MLIIAYIIPKAPKVDFLEAEVTIVLIIPKPGRIRI